DRQDEYARKLEKTLRDQGLRVHADLRNEKIGFKIREHTLQRVPYLLVVGDREAETNTVAVRTRSGEDLGTMSVEDIGRRLAEEVATHGHAVLEG
ncbi:MAG TPA: threonine--tRNA ligase, partial [Chromatiales bacterium]|nr:threonine--tRNA ligase [Chromatiales bacterium]